MSLASLAVNPDRSGGVAAPSAASLDARECKASASTGCETFTGVHRAAWDRHANMAPAGPPPHAAVLGRHALAAQASAPSTHFPLLLATHPRANAKVPRGAMATPLG